MDKPNLYGAGWCPKSTNLRNFLQSEWVDFTYRDVENESLAAEEIRNQYNGKLKFPAIKMPNGEWLLNPDIATLREKLKESKLI